MNSESCVYCGGEATLWTCCGDPVDGSSGTGCLHDDGDPSCEGCGADRGFWDDSTKKAPCDD